MIALLIYLTGIPLAIMVFLSREYFLKKYLTYGDIINSIIMSIFSWLTIIIFIVALFVTFIVDDVVDNSFWDKKICG